MIWFGRTILSHFAQKKAMQSDGVTRSPACTAAVETPTSRLGSCKRRAEEWQSPSPSPQLWAKRSVDSGSGTCTGSTCRDRGKAKSKANVCASRSHSCPNGLVSPSSPRPFLSSPAVALSLVRKRPHLSTSPSFSSSASSPFLSKKASYKPTRAANRHSSLEAKHRQPPGDAAPSHALTASASATEDAAAPGRCTPRAGDPTEGFEGLLSAETEEDNERELQYLVRNAFFDVFVSLLRHYRKYVFYMGVDSTVIFNGTSFLRMKAQETPQKLPFLTYFIKSDFFHGYATDYFRLCPTTTLCLTLIFLSSLLVLAAAPPSYIAVFWKKASMPLSFTYVIIVLLCQSLLSNVFFAVFSFRMRSTRA